MTSLINKPDGYLQGRLSDKSDADYYKSAQEMTKQEQYILKAATGIEKFLQKAMGGNVALADITVENGRIKGLNAPLDKLLNDPRQNQTYLDYRADILAIKNYERM